MPVPKIIGTCLALLLAAQGLAADRALLIGVGDYALPGARLPGIPQDVATMRELLGELGFDDRHIHTLVDREATLSAIRIAFQRHLIHGVGADDRVVIYFSGHGTQVPDTSGDEADGVDETLLPFDARLATRGGTTVLENTLLDDEMESLLSAIPAGEVIVIVDACHSGTVTRALDPGDAGHVSKSFVYEGMPVAVAMRSIDREDATLNYVALSAAADDQLAIATERGSVFTAAVVEVIDESPDAVAVSDLVDRVSEKIKTNVQPERVFTPQLGGDRKMADRILLRRAEPAGR